jgi:pSer/pThr/pTyr-binding forkhead associated (FHA) protein
VEGPAAPKSFVLDHRLTTVGRGEANDIVLDGPQVSKRHALLSIRGDGEVLLEDLNSRNGVWVDEERVSETLLRPGMSVDIGGYRLRYERTDTRAGDPPAARARIEAGYRLLIADGQGWSEAVPLRADCAYIGKSEDNDVVLPGADVSRRHAMLCYLDGAWELQDLESTNGTHVQGQSIEQAAVLPGERIRIGRYLLAIEGPGHPVAREELEAEAARQIKDLDAYLPWKTQVKLLLILLVICVLLVVAVALRLLGRH